MALGVFCWYFQGVAVVTAAAAGQFHVYTAQHVDEAMEILTGVSAGHPDANAQYPAGTVNGQVQHRLTEWTALRQRYASPAGNHGET